MLIARLPLSRMADMKPPWSERTSLLRVIGSPCISGARAIELVVSCTALGLSARVM